MNEPKIAARSPFKVKMEAGKAYFWCSCGLSQKQPFCDGAHKKDQKFSPHKWVAEKDEVLFLCGCKRTKNVPLCDGTHAKLEE